MSLITPPDARFSRVRISAEDRSSSGSRSAASSSGGARRSCSGAARWYVDPSVIEKVVPSLHARDDRSSVPVRPVLFNSLRSSCLPVADDVTGREVVVAAVYLVRRHLERLVVLLLEHGLSGRHPDIMTA